ncbi:hypothetical protein ACPV5U_24480 [Vibrio mediterranei]
MELTDKQNEFIKAVGTKAQLKRVLRGLPDKEFTKLSNLFLEVSAEVEAERNEEKAIRQAQMGVFGDQIAKWKQEGFDISLLQEIIKKDGC